MDREWSSRLLDGSERAVLIMAPPGCGKTEQVARFAGDVVEAGVLAPSQRLLALTFSKKARASLGSRIAQHIGPFWRRSVAAWNFHGLAFALARQHATLLGLEEAPRVPRTVWLREQTVELAGAHGISYWDARDLIAAAGRDVKTKLFVEDELDAAMADYSALAGDYQRRLRLAGESDYDDLMRLGCRALAIADVAQLLQARYPFLVVDEIQDLTEEQMGMALRMGHRGRVFAGDLQQAIYGWAGARPAAVLHEVERLDPIRVPLVESWRSSPAVLAAVSKISVALGGPEIVSARPDDWPSAAMSIVQYDDVEQEAVAVTDMATRWLAEGSAATVGIMARSNARTAAVRSLLDSRRVTAEYWDDPTYDADVVRLLRSQLPSLDEHADDPVSDLLGLCLATAGPIDVETMDQIHSALDALSKSCRSFEDLRDTVHGLRTKYVGDEPVGPGLHVLSSHKGKGQEFDRVIVLGLEEDILPSYPAISEGTAEALRGELRTLLVMMSRAAEVLVLTRASVVPTTSGTPRRRDPSRFLQLLRTPSD